MGIAGSCQGGAGAAGMGLLQAQLPGAAAGASPCGPLLWKGQDLQRKLQASVLEPEQVPDLYAWLRLFTAPQSLSLYFSGPGKSSASNPLLLQMHCTTLSSSLGMN